MNLHTAIPTEPETPAITEQNISCPGCGGKRFHKRTYGRYSEWYIKDYSGGHEGEDWDDLDQNQDESDPWECRQCGHTLTDEITDFLDDF